ncbi:hypothetical protein [Oleidesulfovibrio sp.]|uniref:hypothetical protein n=1 Tax=Oleidesulfovibrio sp. TaxID=2909707 RepID=UPI003A853432
MKVLHIHNSLKERRPRRAGTPARGERSGEVVLCYVLPRRQKEPTRSPHPCPYASRCSGPDFSASAPPSGLTGDASVAISRSAPVVRPDSYAGNVDASMSGAESTVCNFCSGSCPYCTGQMCRNCRLYLESAASAVRQAACSGSYELPAVTLSLLPCLRGNTALVARIQQHANTLRRLLAPEGGVFFAARLRKEMRRFSFVTRRIDPPQV